MPHITWDQDDVWDPGSSLWEPRSEAQLQHSLYFCYLMRTILRKFTMGYWHRGSESGEVWLITWIHCTAVSSWVELLVWITVGYIFEIWITTWLILCLLLSPRGLLYCANLKYNMHYVEWPRSTSLATMNPILVFSCSEGAICWSHGLDQLWIALIIFS